MEKQKVFLVALMVCSAVAAWALTDADTEPIDPPALDLVRVSLWRHADDTLLFEIATRGEMVPDSVRVLLLERDTAGRDERQAAAWMLERGRLYRRSSATPGWAWDEVATALSVAASNMWIAQLPPSFSPAGMAKNGIRCR